MSTVNYNEARLLQLYDYEARLLQLYNYRVGCYSSV